MAERGRTGAPAEVKGTGTGAIARVAATGRFLALFAAVLAILAWLDLLPWPGVLVAFLAAVLLMAILPLREPAGGGPRGPAPPVVAMEPAATRLTEAFDPASARRRRVVFARRARAAFPLRPGDVLTARLRAPDLVAAFNRVATGGKPVMVEFVERVPTERWFAAWFAPLNAPGDATDRQSAIVLILDDLSERRQTERVRVDFVANASHELRTPLAHHPFDTCKARRGRSGRAPTLPRHHARSGGARAVGRRPLSLSRIN
jgi:two-component system phosphate regulon sensor histidine kinase PhoR